MTIEILKPDCNLETIKDGRGGIFTWIPKEPIVEFNMLYFNAGKVRGFHFHPHFIEYLLVVDGNGTLVTREDPKDKNTESFIHLSKGMCTRTEKNTYHHQLLKLMIKIIQIGLLGCDGFVGKNLSKILKKKN